MFQRGDKRLQLRIVILGSTSFPLNIVVLVFAVKQNLSQIKILLQYTIIYNCSLSKNPLKISVCSILFYYFSGGGEVRQRSCILCHQGPQLILAYNWARPAILAAGEGRGGMFLFLMFHHILSFSSLPAIPLFHLLYYLIYLFSPYLWETTQNDPQGLTCH